MCVSSLCFYLSILSPSVSSCFDWKTRAAERQTSSDQLGGRVGRGGGHRQTGGQTDRNTDKGPLIPQTWSWCRAEEHSTENVFIPPSLAQKHERGLKRKLFPLRPLSAVTNALAASLRLHHWACVTVFSYACRRSWCEKAAHSPYSSVVVSACCSLWVWLHYHLPPRAYFPFSKTCQISSSRKHLPGKKQRHENGVLSGASPLHTPRGKGNSK